MTPGRHDIDAEVEFHIEETVDALVQQGWTEEDARVEAERRFGGTTRYRRELSAMSAVTSRWDRLRNLVSVDWRDALRSLRTAPVVTASAILSLALGIGANTALFSIVNGLLLKPLPVHEPERLALFGDGDWSNPVWERLRDHHGHLFAGAAAWSNETFDLAETGESERIEAAYASGRFFDTLGVRAQLGRTLTVDDDRRSGGLHGPVAVISHRLWQRRFEGSSDVLGRRLTVNRLPFTIVGVMPEGFFGAEVGRFSDVYIPLATEALLRGHESTLDGRSSSWLQILFRLRDGQTIAGTTAELNQARPAIREATLPLDRPPAQQAQYLSQEFSLEDARNGRSTLRGRFANPLLIVTIIVAGVLLIACANVANLMLARATARRPEMSVRLALGASRGRIARQLVAEAFLLSLLGTAIGMLVARWGAGLLVSQLGSSVYTISLDLSMDWRVLSLTAAIATVTTVLFGLAPALGLSGIQPTHALRDIGRGEVGDRRVNYRSALVVVQVAVSLVLVVGAVLFVRTFHGLATVPLGFDPEPLAIVNIDASRTQVPPEALADLYQRAADAAASAAGVRMAAASMITPLSGRGWNGRVYRSPDTGLSGNPVTFFNAVGPGWFQTLGMRLLAGRDISPLDVSGGSPVVVVNETFARRFLGGVPPIGARVAVGHSETAPEYEIIGVVNDAVYRSGRGGVPPTVYHPVTQAESLRSAFAVTVQVPGDRAGLAQSMRDALRGVHPALSFAIRDYDDQFRATVAQERLIAMLTGFFGGLALLLAGIGLYGVTSYAVTRRTRELAVRMALGADATVVVRLVLQSVLSVVAIGATIGIALSLWASSFVNALLFGVTARDPLTMAGAVLVLAVVSLFAGWIPARRASRLDPNVVLRR
jgi:putative ABC transport system permease protein